jgi:4-carboxymuconolactone decarboxylase
MTEEDRYEQGMGVRRKVLGDAWVDRSLKNRNEFNSEFQELITRHVWGDIWTRPGLDQKTRRCMVLSTMLALGRWEEFRLHARAGLAGELTKNDLKEIILQATVYCGAPAGNHAMHEAEAVLAEMGM